MVSLGFHVGGFLSSGFLLGFFRFHLGSLNFRVSFRIQTGENKAKELGFHLGSLWDSLAFRVSLRFTFL
jgi:hypothetical protein